MYLLRSPLFHLHNKLVVTKVKKDIGREEENVKTE